MTEDRREKIIEGLRRAKARGKKLGNPRLAQSRNSDLASANQVRKENARSFASGMIVVLKQLTLEGFCTEKEIVAELNRRKIPARRGGEWSPTQYRQLWVIIEDMGYVGLGFKKLKDKGN